jgi:hypothetical protein
MLISSAAGRIGKNGARPEAAGGAQARLRAAKRAFVTRRVSADALRGLITSGAPAPGDLVLARVERIFQHRCIELPDGRRAQLHVGDEVLVAYGNRYAPDQFEAVVPADLGPTHLVASGGIAAALIAKHDDAKTPTELCPVGLVAGPDGARINLASWSLPPLPEPEREAAPPVLVVVGTSMNAGKTFMVTQLAKGLARAGYLVGAVKITGTGSGHDLWSWVDAGAARVCDFTDAGLATTSGVGLDALRRVCSTLFGHLAGADVILVEVADGLLQRETAALLAAPWFRERVDGYFFAAPNALSAIGGIAALEGIGVRPLGVGGLLTRSPLAVREAQSRIDLPILPAEQLCEPERAAAFAGLAAAGRRGALQSRATP